MKADHHYLDTVGSILCTLQEEIGNPVCGSARGYLDAIDDLLYACSLGKVALEYHLTTWCTYVPLNENDQGYVLAIHDVANALSELNYSEKWSGLND